LEKTLHSRAESATNGSSQSIGWGFKFSFYYLVVRKDSVMPSKDCVKEYKVRSFAFYMGACAFAVGVLAILFALT
jgi:hypothetical protein